MALSKHKFILITITIINCFFCYAQNQTLDSLKLALKNAKHDTVKYNTLMRIGDYFTYSNSDTSIYYHNLAIEIANKLVGLDGILKKGQAIKENGTDFLIKGEYDKALSYYEKSLEISKNQALYHDKQFILKAKLLQSSTLGAIGNVYLQTSKYEEALKYYFNALKLNSELDHKGNQAAVLGNIGLVYLDQGEYLKALENFTKALKLNEELGNKDNQAANLGNIGYVYSDQGDYSKALDYYFKALQINEQTGNKTYQGANLGNIGIIYEYIKDYDNALKYYIKALKLFNEMKDKNNIPSCFSNIGNIYRSKNDYMKALEYYDKALKIALEIGDKHSQTSIIGNIGSVYSDQGNFNKALEYYNHAKEIAEEIGDKTNQATFLGNIGNTYCRLNQYKKAESYLKKAEQMNRELGAVFSLKDNYYFLTEVYTKTGRPIEALKYYKEHIVFRDSVKNEQNMKALIQKEMQFNFDKKATADSIKVAEEKKLNVLKLKEEKTQKYYLYTGLILLIIFLFFIYNRFKTTQKQKQIIEVKEKETQQQKHIIEEKQKEILDSINYAKRIQYTLLAHKEFLNENLPDHFTFFNPKDIVSGDFYWATKHNNKFYLAVCDSTGHGVPGAFMSLLNIGFLTEAINEKGIEKPNDVFDYVRLKLTNTISKEGQKDGFDGILICIDQLTKSITYAAANNAPILISNKQYIELDADRMPVGVGERKENFTLHSIDANNGDMLYLYTDGYADQFGGPRGKKFKYKQLNELLLALHSKPLTEQYFELKNSFENWRGELEQVDDVCIIGIKI
jgi:tetratricopeptide (TPR) repeat protein